MDYHQKPHIDYSDDRRPVIISHLLQHGRGVRKTFFQTRESELAGEHLERAAILDPEVPEFQFQLARDHVLWRDWTGANEAVQKLLQLHPTHELGLALKRLLGNRSEPPN